MHPFEDLIVPENAVGIHWFGQNSFALKDPADTIVQVDPYYPRERPPEQFVHPRPPLDEASLRTDYVLLTHDHLDHTFVESLLRIRAAYPGVQFIGPKESARRMQEAGIPAEQIITVTAGDETTMGTMRAHAVWSKPPRAIPEDDLLAPDVEHLGYVVDTGAVRIYICGDPIRTFGDHEDLLKPVRDLKPDIGLLTTWRGRGEFPSFTDSAKIAVSLGLKTAVPAHYSCFVGVHWDPQEWASHLPPDGPKPLIIPYNQSVVYRPGLD